VIWRALLAAVLLLATARASANQNYNYPTEAAALADCNQVLISIANAGRSTGPTLGACSRHIQADHGYAGFYGIQETYSSGGANYEQWYLWFLVADEPTECEAKEPFDGKVTLPTGTSLATTNALCFEGCQYYAAGGVESGGVFTGKLYPFPGGQTCTDGDSFSTVPAGEGQGEICIPNGVLSQCYNVTTGQTCAVTPRGNKACWSPGETSTKVSPDQAEALTNSTSDSPPAPSPLQNAQTTTQVNVPASSTSTSTTTNTTYITYANVTGQPGTATQGPDSDGDATGSDPEGNGSGSGDGDAGEAGEGVGDGLYEGTEETYGSIIADYFVQVQDAPIVSAVTGIFDVDDGGASCPPLEAPTWDLLGYHFEGYSLTWHCSGPLSLALDGVAVILFIFAAWAAFKWAFGET
jgi:hypothetical protein